jgi:hypothetical protein
MIEIKLKQTNSKDPLKTVKMLRYREPTQVLTYSKINTSTSPKNHLNKAKEEWKKNKQHLKD